MFCFRPAMHIIYLCYHRSAGDVGLLTNTFFFISPGKGIASPALLMFSYTSLWGKLLCLLISVTLFLVRRRHTRLVMGVCIRYGNLTRPDWAVSRHGVLSQRDIKRPVPD